MPKSKKKIAASDKSQPIHKPKKKKKHSSNPIINATADERTSKQATLIALLEHPNGATIGDLASRLGWQRHSVHGVMSGVLRKKLALTITSNAEERGRVYRITRTSRI